MPDLFQFRVNLFQFRIKLTRIKSAIATDSMFTKRRNMLAKSALNRRRL